MHNLGFAPLGDFGRAVSHDIKKYQTEHGTTGDWRLWHKTIILWLLFGYTYYLIIWRWANLSVFELVLACAGMIAAIAGIGFNVMHDGSHGSFSKKKWINYLAGFSLNFLGGNNFLWEKKHVTLHHRFTNVPEHDEDIEAPLLRFHPDQPWKWYHRCQKYYWWVMYSLLYLGWIYIGDFKKYFSQKILEHRFVMKPIDHVVFWSSKLLYGLMFIYIPLQHMPLSQFLSWYLPVLFMCGFVIAIVFQLAHSVPEAAHPSIPESDEQATLVRLEYERSYHQVVTTANFSTKNAFVRWWLGGLNFQIEHHVAPHVSHVHYLEIQKIIVRRCNEFSVPYQEFPSVWKAMCAHVRLLAQLGEKPKNLAV